MPETFECEVKSISETTNKNSTAYTVKMKGISKTDSKLKIDLSLKSTDNNLVRGFSIGDINYIVLKDEIVNPTM